MDNLNQNPNQLETPPNNNLVFAILATVLCCLPTGIYAIIKATEVNAKWAAGDKVGAVASANQAKQWAIYSAVAGVVVILIYLFILGGMAALGASAYQ